MEARGSEEKVIPVQAQVSCEEGVCGRSTYVLINPITDQVTHVVVKDATSPHKEYVVPVSAVANTTVDTIALRLSKSELEGMEPFMRTAYIEERMPDRGHAPSGYGYGWGSYPYLPYSMPERIVKVQVERMQVPPGELAIRRGARVEATDGYVGRVDEFLVNPDNGNITHLVMREGHLWGQKDVSIPMSAVRHMREDTVFLTLDKQQVESLPIIPLHRRGARDESSAR